MARIRSIKPDFFTDKKTGSLSCRAQVLFFGLIVHADDYGVLRYEPEELRVKLFGHDRSGGDTTALVENAIEELIAAAIINRFIVSGRTYIHLRNFVKHQRISKRAAPLLPRWSMKMVPSEYLKLVGDSYVSEQDYDAEHIEEEEEDDLQGQQGGVAVPEVNLARKPTPLNLDALKVSPEELKDNDGKADRCPHKEIVELYHEHFNGPKVLTWPRHRQVKLRALWKLNPSLEYWTEFFKTANKSALLRGEAGDWKATLEWMLNPNKHSRIAEGEYTETGNSRGFGNQRPQSTMKAKKSVFVGLGDDE